MAGVSSSGFRGGGRLGRADVGGGDRRRGDTGQRGVSLRCSAVMGDFWGAETRVGEAVDTGPSLGVVAAEILVEEEPGVGAALVILEGLVSSCVLDLLGLEGVLLMEADRVSRRLGDVSREFDGEESVGS